MWHAAAAASTSAAEDGTWLPTHEPDGNGYTSARYASGRKVLAIFAISLQLVQDYSVAGQAWEWDEGMRRSKG